MRKGYHYTESGLTNVWLANGYEIRQTKYGNGVAFQDIAGLHRCIARMLASKSRLTGAEIRFLRKELGLSQAKLGKLIGVTEQAVALWEKKGRMPKAADRLLRLIYVEHDAGNVPIVRFIEELNDTDDHGNEDIVATQDGSGWRLAA